MNKCVLFVFITILSQTKPQVVQFGDCADVKPMTYFALDKFLGLWYEIERFPMWYEENGDCAYKKIQSCGRRIEIEHGYVRDGIHFILKMNSSYIPGDDAVFVIEDNEIDSIGIPFTIISTDYVNYAVAYGCKFNAVVGIKYISAWILSRDTTLDSEIHQKARIELNALPYSSATYLQRVNQEPQFCEHYWIANIKPSNNKEEILIRQF